LVALVVFKPRQPWQTKNSGSKLCHRRLSSPKPIRLFSEIMTHIAAVVADVASIRAQVATVSM
jgi:hypothetical protein